MYSYDLKDHMVQKSIYIHLPLLFLPLQLAMIYFTSVVVNDKLCAELTLNNVLYHLNKM